MESMREKYESLSAAALKELAKVRGLKHISGLRKSEVIERMLEADVKENGNDESISKPDEKMENKEVKHNKEIRDNKEGKENTRKTGSPSGSGTAGGNNGSAGGSRNSSGNGSSYSYGSNGSQSNTGSNGGYSNSGYNSGNSGYSSNNNNSNNSSGGSNNNYGSNNNSSTSNNSSSSYSGNNGNSNNSGNSNSNNSNSGNSNNNSSSNNSSSNNNNSASIPSSELSQLDSGQQASGILEVLPDGYGFIRCENYLPGENDVYVSPSQIRRFNLKTGDIIAGNTRVKTQQEKFSALLYLKMINGLHPAEAAKRLNFEDMTPIFPNERLRMERGPKDVSMRIMDMISPIGKGQRGMIVSPPKAGKTTLLKDVAKSILRNSPQMHLIILLIDERPEEVTDIKEAICGPNVEVIYSTFDELPEHHKRVSEMVIERAKRLVEHRKDVTILLDSITRLARAYNLTVPPSGRTLSGGLDPAALHMPKRFFGAARNMREGGSLTILATALVDTGSKMDDVVYEEFKGTGNMELVLDRKLSEKRVFPAIDIPKSGTRRDDLLLDADEQEAAYIMRKALNGMKSDEAVENILNLFVRTRNNKEFTTTVRRQKYI